MLTITANNLGKKFNREWIFRGVQFNLPAAETLLIQGGNGSGKSTLLQTLSGFISPSEGAVNFTLNNVAIEADKMRHYLALASPYLQIIEDFSAVELIDHLQPPKPFLNSLNAKEIIDIAELSHAKNKFIKHYSSGMKQRLKLALAFLADTPLLLLDEPLSNLDKNATVWYKSMVTTYGKDRTIIVCSNAIEDEHYFCKRTINVMDFKRP